MIQRKLFTLTMTSSASASTTTIGAAVLGLDDFDTFQINASLAGATGGTLDVYLQRKIDADVWQDWIHFPQLSAGSTKHYAATASAPTGITEVGTGTDSAATPALAANANAGGHPCLGVRLVCVTGSGVSAGGAQTVRITGLRNV